MQLRVDFYYLLGEKMKFIDMNLPDCIVQALDTQGIVEPTEIQTAAIPLIKGGADVIGLSQTGSGKTYAYGIPAIECVERELNATQVLIICPTRELVTQVVEGLKKLLVHDENRFSITPVMGGAHMDRQKLALKKGARIVVGTPGRLMDHLRKKTLKLDNLKLVVLDEADEMLDMGFKPDIETILKSTKPERQTVMFSATMPPAIKKLTAAFMREPVTVKAQNCDNSPALIKQYFVNCKKTEKVDMLKRVYDEMHPYISIVFCNTKRMTEELAETLNKRELPVVALHGDMRQRERSRTMDNFKKEGGVLVATDVAARGIDIKNVDIIVNFDFPNNEDYYVHRIGRTGRAGKAGVAFTIINTVQQAKALRDLVKKLGGTAQEYPNLSTTKFLSDEPDRNAFAGHDFKNKPQKENDKMRSNDKYKHVERTPKTDRPRFEERRPKPSGEFKRDDRPRRDDSPKYDTRPRQWKDNPHQRPEQGERRQDNFFGSRPNNRTEQGDRPRRDDREFSPRRNEQDRPSFGSFNRDRKPREQSFQRDDYSRSPQREERRENNQYEQRSPRFRDERSQSSREQRIPRFRDENEARPQREQRNPRFQRDDRFSQPNRNREDKFSCSRVEEFEGFGSKRFLTNEPQRKSPSRRPSGDRPQRSHSDGPRQGAQGFDRPQRNKGEGQKSNFNNPQRRSGTSSQQGRSNPNNRSSRPQPKGSGRPAGSKARGTTNRTHAR
jgi:superfamily II DNA/RNA helicase